MARRNPFEEIERLVERMNRQFNEASQLPAVTGGQTVSMDVAEHDDEYVVTVDLPGYEKEDIELSISNRTLRVSADHEERTDESDEAGTYLRQERSHQSVTRTITLPEEVNEDETSAAYNNGVLTVTVPKRSETSDSRSIDIS